jgi:hypothetical protein
MKITPYKRLLAGLFVGATLFVGLWLRGVLSGSVAWGVVVMWDDAVKWALLLICLAIGCSVKHRK